MGTHNDIWAERNIKPGEIDSVRVGPLGIWLKQIDDEWDLAIKRIPKEEGSSDEDYENLISATDVKELNWLRWVAGTNEMTWCISPAMPDRAIVVRPETQFNVLPNHSALFFVSIPVRVKINVGRRESLIAEEPSVVLSNTWFGEPVSGELCYSLTTRARRKALDKEAMSHCAVCPVWIFNSASTPLSFARLCLRVGHLAIFRGRTQLWTNEIRVTYEGGEGQGKIQYIEGAPKDGETGEVIAPPREPLTRGLIESGLRNLRIFG